MYLQGGKVSSSSGSITMISFARVLLVLLFLDGAAAIRLEAGVRPACVSGPQTAVSWETQWPSEEWQTASPESEGMDSDILARTFDYIRERHTHIHSFLIVRNGRMILNACFYPFREGQLHDLASVTKSVTTSLIGIAIGRGMLSGVHQPVLQTFPERHPANPSPRKAEMTIENLLTMTSGLDCRFRGGEVTLHQMMQSKDWIQFMLDLPMATQPGTVFEYCSGGMHLLSGIVSQSTGSTALEFARKELFEPLGIHDVAWPADLNSISHGWGDLHLKPVDMARIGYLWLNRGRWEQRQVIPADWMNEAVQVHSTADWGDSYGYGFWVYPNRNPAVYEGNGRGGQRISVVPGKNLIVVFTGGGFEPGEIGDFIGQALKSDGPLPENPSAFAKLQQAVLAAAQPPVAQPVPPNPPVSQAISGRHYVMKDNPLGLKSFTLTFQQQPDEAAIELQFTDDRIEHRPIGLDGVPRLSGGRFDLPVALKGAWVSKDTFLLDYDEVATINSYQLQLEFKKAEVKGQLRERTGLMEETSLYGMLKD